MFITITFQNENTEDIVIRGIVNKTGYVPGEIINITLDINNTQKFVIKNVNFTMIQVYRIAKCIRGYNIFETTLPNIFNSKEEEIKETFSVIVPSVSIPPSFRFQDQVDKFIIANIGYLLRLSIKVEELPTNIKIDIPITLGTDPTDHIHHQGTSNPLVIVPYSSEIQ